MKGLLKKIPQDIKRILNTISARAQARRVRAYVVGGMVRDILLGRSNADIDIVVEGNAIELAQEIASQHSLPCRSHQIFGTAVVTMQGHKIDFVTARRESYAHPGALPVVEPATLREDLFRRDFTINAMAISINAGDYGTLIDFYGGRLDLKKGVLRVLHDASFRDDATRILRCMRFACRFRFRIEKHTQSLLRHAVRDGMVRTIHPHRMRDELMLHMHEQQPYRCLRLVSRVCGLEFIHPHLRLNQRDSRLFGGIGRAGMWYHGHAGCVRRLDMGVVYLTALLIRLPIKEINKVLAEFDFSRGVRLRVVSAKVNTALPGMLRKTTMPHAVYRICERISFETLLYFYAAVSSPAVRQRIRMFLIQLAARKLKIKGADLQKLGLAPAQWYSAILDGVLDAVIARGLTTKKQELVEAQRVYEYLAKR